LQLSSQSKPESYGWQKPGRVFNESILVIKIWRRFEITIRPPFTLYGFRTFIEHTFAILNFRPSTPLDYFHNNGAVSLQPQEARKMMAHSLLKSKK